MVIASSIAGDNEKEVELREACMQTLEVLCRLACPALQDKVPDIVALCRKNLVYDPNYDEEADDDEMEEDDDADVFGTPCLLLFHPHPLSTPCFFPSM